MADREDILAALKENKPAHTALPDVNISEGSGADLVDQFKEIVAQVGGQVLDVETGVADALRAAFPDLEPVYAESLEATGKALAGLQLFVCKGALGVAENGAIWVDETMLNQRIAPFITQHLAIVLDRQKIVSHMHAAYEQINVNENGFGVFIAGPSKTADIEQSLVLGAHGPRSLTVLLV